MIMVEFKTKQLPLLILEQTSFGNGTEQEAINSYSNFYLYDDIL